MWNWNHIATSPKGNSWELGPAGDSFRLPFPPAHPPRCPQGFSFCARKWALPKAQRRWNACGLLGIRAQLTQTASAPVICCLLNEEARKSAGCVNDIFFFSSSLIPSLSELGASQGCTSLLQTKETLGSELQAGSLAHWRNPVLQFLLRRVLAWTHVYGEAEVFVVGMCQYLALLAPALAEDGKEMAKSQRKCEL